MILEIFALLCSAALAVTGSLTFWPVHHGYEFYIPVVLAVAGYILGVLLVFFFLWLFGVPVKNKENLKHQLGWSKFWFSQAINFIDHHALIIIKFKGKEKVPANQRFLLVSNHRSNFDPIVSIHKLHKHGLTFISKQSNFKIPIVKNYLKSLLFIPIDRNDAMQSLQGMKKAIDIINNDASSIGVYPEGTRQQKEIIGPFHEGVFNIAIKAHCPIVVMTVKNTEKIHKHFPWRFTKIYLEVIRVISPDEFDTLPAKTVSDKVREMMIENLKEN